MSYEALIEDLIDSQSQLLGERAVATAQDVRGLHVNADGTVDELTADGKVVVDDLVSAYVDSVGRPAKMALQSVATEYEGELDLPRSLS